MSSMEKEHICSAKSSLENFIDLTMDENDFNQELEIIQRSTQRGKAIVVEAQIVSPKPASQKAKMSFKAPNPAGASKNKELEIIQRSTQRGKAIVVEAQFVSPKPASQKAKMSFKAPNPGGASKNKELEIIQRSTQREKAIVVEAQVVSPKPASQKAKMSFKAPNPDGASSSRMVRKRKEDSRTVFHYYEKKLTIAIPKVITNGGIPNGPITEGFLFKYDPTEILIQCSCHSTVFSPRGFLVHGGGDENTVNPLTSIKVVVDDQ